jgi:acetyltransferase-like isoleucine patch superfamily enzyme
MRKLIFIFFIYQTLTVLSQPTNNPYKEKYSNSSFHWTDDLPWEKVYNINSYAGTTLELKLINAQNDIVSKGGGVLYFPKGDYFFNENITLRNGVIWRGEPSLNSDAKSDAFAPLTRFIFPKFEPITTGNSVSDKSKAFKRIRSEYTNFAAKTTIPNDTVRNIGIIDIDINRANIILHPSYVNYLPKGSGSTNYIPCYLENVIVMGVRNNNVAFPLPGSRPNYQNKWQEWPWRYMANIDALVQKNLVISNNRFNDLMNNSIHPITDESFDQPGYKVLDSDTNDTITYTDGAKARFSYTNHYGLIVNRFYNFYEISNGIFSTGDLILCNDNAAELESAKYPSIFNKGVEILDNYMYNTQQVAFFVAGQGMVIKNNVIKDNNSKSQWVSRSGLYRIKYDAFLENRAIDFSGFDVLIENNEIEVYRTKFETSSYYSNDGEGIMLQECCGGSRANDIKILKNTLIGSNAYIGLYKTRDITNVSIKDNVLSEQDIYLNANTNSTDYSCYNVTVTGNKGVRNITLTGSKSGSDCAISNNTGSGKIEASCYVNQSFNSGFTLPVCTTIKSLSNEPDSICTNSNESKICLPPFYQGGDSLCFTIPSGCTLNVEKAQWKCLNEGYPMVEFSQSADTVFINSATSFSTNAVIKSGNVDSIMLICNGKLFKPRRINTPDDNIDVTKRGIYNLIYKLWGCNGSTAYSKQLIVINKPSTSALYQQNNDNSKTITTYPNPTYNFVRVNINEVFSYRVFNTGSQLIKQGFSKQGEIDLSNFNAGIYIIEIRIGDMVSNLRIVKL